MQDRALNALCMWQRFFVILMRQFLSNTNIRKITISKMHDQMACEILVLIVRCLLDSSRLLSQVIILTPILQKRKILLYRTPKIAFVLPKKQFRHTFFQSKLTGSNGLSVAKPLDLHGRISNGSDLGVEVNLLALDDGQVPEGRHEGWGRITGCLLDLAALLGSAPLDMLQVNHFRFVLFSKKAYKNKEQKNIREIKQQEIMYQALIQTPSSVKLI